MLRRLLPESRFLRRLAMLSGGTFLGQLVLVASSPLLTRLYGPEAFGALAVFSSLSAVLGTVAALRYEFAVPVAADEDEAADLVRVAFAASALTAALAALGAWAAGPWLARVTEIPGLAGLLLPLLPPAVLVQGLATGLGFWSIRRGTFRVNTVGRVVQAAGQAGPQLALGPAGAGAPGLVAGYVLGYFARLLHFLHALPAAERARLLRGSGRSPWPAARRHWRYPAYSAPSALLEGGTQLLPAVLLAVLYGPAAAGWFGLSQRVVGLPVRLVAQAASSVFLGEAPGLAGDAAALRRLFLRSAAVFAALGIVGMGPVLVLGPSLFALVFGEPWREAGAVAALLVPQHLARFVVVPVSQTLNIRGRQDLHLAATLAGALAVALAFGAAALLGLGLTRAILLYSAGTTAAYLLYFWFAWRVARRPGGSGGEVAPPPGTTTLDA